MSHMKNKMIKILNKDKEDKIKIQIEAIWERLDMITNRLNILEKKVFK